MRRLLCWPLAAAQMFEPYLHPILRYPEPDCQGQGLDFGPRGNTTDYFSSFLKFRI